MIGGVRPLGANCVARLATRTQLGQLDLKTVNRTKSSRSGWTSLEGGSARDPRLPAETLMWLVTAASLRPKNPTTNLGHVPHFTQRHTDALGQRLVLRLVARFTNCGSDILRRHNTAVSLEDLLDVSLE